MCSSTVSSSSSSPSSSTTSRNTANTYSSSIDCNLDCELYNTFLHFGGPSEMTLLEPREECGCRPRSRSCTRFQREPRRSSYRVGSDDETTATCISSSQIDHKEFTTVMIHNLQPHVNVNYLEKVLQEAGFEGAFDFLYVPLNFKTHEAVGFAFINFADEVYAQKMVDGFNGLVINGHLPLAVEPAKNQGLQTQIDHLRESPVNAADEEFRPKLFELGSGRSLEFPAPTNPRPPRRSHRHRRRVREYVPQKARQVEVCDPYAQTHLKYSMALGDLLL